MKTILVVDDQRCVRELIMEELGDEGYRVQGAGDRESTLRQLGNSSPDLVTLDIYLENGKGWKLLGEIKEKQPDLPVIVLTAYDSFTDDQRLKRADGYVIKSLDGFENLKSKIAGVLGSNWRTGVQVSQKYMKPSTQLV